MSTQATYAGELHYWRYERSEWKEIFSRCKELGLTAIATCVPWSVHERAAGRYDFSGARDLGAFLDTAEAEDLPVRLFLGPVVGAQLNGFGIPKRVLGDERCQVKNARGRPLWLPWPTQMFPAPSFSARSFRGEVERWFSALGEHLGSRQVSAEVRCGRSALGRVGAFDGDYHPDAIESWLGYSEGVSAPRFFSEEHMPTILQWIRFSELCDERAEQWLTKAAERAGISVATNRLARLDIGGAPWFPIADDVAQRNSVLMALASATSTFSLSSIVPRERWAGALDATPWIPKLLAALHRVKFHQLRRRAPIALVLSRAEERAAMASCALTGTTAAMADWLDLGRAGYAALSLDESARNYPHWLAAVEEALALIEVPYLRLGEHELHKIDGTIKAVLHPTLRRVDGGVWAALHALAGSGIQVVLGPEKPVEDELGRPLGDDSVVPEGAGFFSPESLLDKNLLARALLSLAGDLPERWMAPEFPEVSCTALYDSQEVAKLLFVRNRGAESVKARVCVPRACVLRDALNDQVEREECGQVTLTFAALEVRVFLIEENPKC